MAECTDHLGNKFSSKKEMCEYWGISYSTFMSRIKSGWNLGEALTDKKCTYKCKDHIGKEFNSKQEMCEYWGVSRTTFNSRIKSGLTLEEALGASGKGLETKANRLGYNIKYIGKSFKNEDLYLDKDTLEILEKHKILERIIEGEMQ